MHFDNGIIQNIYDEYSQYFAGTYMDNYVLGVSIKNNTPESVINLLSEANIPYRFTEYNYTELWDIYKLVINHEKFGEYGGAGISYRDNCISVYIPIGYIFPEEFSKYVESGTIILTESDLEPSF
jgi:hypothetical protein